MSTIASGVLPRISLRDSSAATAENVAAIVKSDGGVVIEGLLSADQVRRFNADIDPHLAALHAGSSHVDASIQDFHGAQTKRLTNLITLSKTFREEIIDNDVVLAIADQMMHPSYDSYWMGTAQVIEIGPGNKAQPHHRDLENYPGYLEMGPSGPEVMINFLIALTDFTEENGATRVVPGSHTWPDFTDRGTPEQTVPALMKAGDALFFSGKLAHGGGANVTKDERRRGVAFTFNPGYLVPEEAYPFTVDIDLARSLSPRVQQLIGFRSFYDTTHGYPGLWQNNYDEIADYIGL
ncbi:phytanoyl-CoA dioxygenase family protein [Mycolicibacterium wolinskyi]|uniref:Phytanoyl-CoA dioxygenase n=1 Tax=Mycolicibacterium wolinskyi TaxID=59750 RepID=A0A1X2F1Y0_9MYCO|nr:MULTISPECIES: phytanoyl-CoA dioxygenase family protein [Mycolicibacterium]MCV7287807.1 phytanoyl-CoA dioxygenase family protein [Mycolicibacterium wolinskyi]MCV7294705.1 phytanoyl-CoA dioxygenase family protein [Mycolicibacterium goodii]ORX12432.1 phytanoyl-CoA dioxygenase [Mycolicibacterium wolinskyi]